MKVDVTTVGSFQKQLAFVVPADEVADQLEQAYKRLAGRIRMAGFRPGKAPRKVLEARFAPQVESDVANDLIQQSYRSALQDHGLTPVGQPNVADTSPVSASDGFRFTITVDVRPTIELTEYTGLDVVFPESAVTPEEVEATVQASLEGHARIEEVTGRPVEKGDLAMVELVVREGDQEVARELGTMIRTEADPYYPGVEALLFGMEVGEEKQAPVSYAADARTPNVAGRTLDTTVKVLSISGRRIPDLDDALAAELGYEGGASGMRTAIEARLREGRDEGARNQARANLIEAVIAKNPFEVPAGMVEDSLRMLMAELRLQNAIRTGRDPQTIGFSEAQVQDLRVRAAFAAKAALILEWVAKKEGLAVSDSDVEARLTKLANERGQTMEAVRGWYAKEGNADDLKERILEEKVLDWLLEHANLVKGPVPATTG